MMFDIVYLHYFDFQTWCYSMFSYFVEYYEREICVRYSYVISWFHIWFASIVLIILFEENQKPEAFSLFFFLISETLGKSSEVSYDVAYFSQDIYWKEKLGCPWSKCMEWHQWKAEKYNSISPISSTKYSLT